MSHLAYECSHGSILVKGGDARAGCEVPGYRGRCGHCPARAKKRPMWRPHLKLVQKHSGAYWYVFWTWQLDHGLVLHPADHAPFMTRSSAAAQAAHRFAAKLNQQRGLAF